MNSNPAPTTPTGTATATRGGSNPSKAVTPAEVDFSAHLVGRCLVTDHAGIPLGYRLQGEDGSYVAVKLGDYSSFRSFETKEGCFWWLLGEEYVEVSPAEKAEVERLLGGLEGFRLEFEHNEIALVEPNGFPQVQVRWFGPKGLADLSTALVAAGGQAGDASPGRYLFHAERFCCGPYESPLSAAQTLAKVYAH